LAAEEDIKVHSYIVNAMRAVLSNLESSVTENKKTIYEALEVSVLYINI
jgi:hypothetical protein